MLVLLNDKHSVPMASPIRAKAESIYLDQINTGIAIKASFNANRDSDCDVCRSVRKHVASDQEDGLTQLLMACRLSTGILLR